MFELFSSYPESNAGGPHPAQWNYVKRHTLENIQKVQNYYHNSSVFINSDHVLIDILYGLGVSMNLPIDDYYREVRNKCLNLAMSLGLTSSVYKGRVQRSAFYGDNCVEVIIASDEPFDYRTDYAEWRQVCAVKPLLHPFTALDMPPPFSHHPHSEYGVAVICINIPMLAVQYRAFVENELKSEDQAGAASFIARYVWPNMLPDHLEQAWFNRLYAKQTRQAIRTHAAKRLPFALLELEKQFMACEQYVLSALDTLNRPTFETQLKTIPSLINENMYQSLILPDVVPTNQVTWALDLARLKHLVFLLRCGKEDSYQTSREWVVQAVRSLQRNYVDSLLQQLLPPEAYLLESNLIGQLMVSYQQ